MTLPDLPAVRDSRVVKFDVAGYDGYLTIGMDGAGNIRQVFVKLAKEGSTLSGFARAWAMAVSIGLRNGTPVSDFTAAMAGLRFEPYGYAQLGDAHVEVDSIVDAWCKILNNQDTRGKR